MPNYVIGTAGHVDHGKTALVKALTGIDADRLIEEKERGMTLDLGFAHITLPSGIVCGIVDVPGHEKYLKNMLAGVGGLDFVLFVVDAGEGIMAQTREHLEILQLLGIQDGIPVISKIDRVPKENLEQVENEFSEFLKGSFLEKSPVIRLSAQTGVGIDKLVAEIDKRVKKLTPRDKNASFRMPVDRVFTLPGIGTVITGTVYQGNTERERTLEILPTGRRGKVRQIQVHNQSADSVEAGQRAALNISKVEMRDVRRGDQVINPNSIRPTKDLDVKLEVLSSAPHPVKNKVKVRLYIATSEVFGKVILLDSDNLEPGESGYARIVLEEEVGAVSGDRFILRAPSAIYTWGGGKVLDPHPMHHRRFDKSMIEMLKLRDRGNEEDIAESVMNREPFRLFNQEMLSSAVSLSLEDTSALIRKLEKENKLYKSVSGRFQLKETMEMLAGKVLDVLNRLQELEPDRLGRIPEEVRRNLPNIESGLFREILIYLKENEKAREKNGLISTADFTPKLTPEQQKAHEWITKEFQVTSFSPPARGDLHKNREIKPAVIDKVLEYMVFSGELVPIDDNIYFTPDNLEKAKRIIGHYIIKEGGITPADARELLGSTRKYVIPLLEYLDKIYFTRRKDDRRVLFRESVMANQ
jgi:selenocysteine-specific elongation factor